MIALRSCFMLLVVITAGAGFAQVVNSALPGQRFSGEIAVNATQEVVWSLLTDVQKSFPLMGYSYLRGFNRFMQVGDAALMKSGDDTGEVVATYMEPMKEVRYTFDPKNGSYLCQQQWKVTTAAGTTKIFFVERYTESGRQRSAQIRAQIRDFNEGLKRLKMMAEGK